MEQQPLPKVRSRCQSAREMPDAGGPLLITNTRSRKCASGHLAPRLFGVITRPKRTVDYSVLTDEQKAPVRREPELDFHRSERDVTLPCDLSNRRGPRSRFRAIQYEIKTFEPLFAAACRPLKKPRDDIVDGPNGSVIDHEASLVDKIRRPSRQSDDRGPTNFAQSQNGVVNQREVPRTLILRADLRTALARTMTCARRRNARSRDDRDGTADRTKGPPHLRDAAHQSDIHRNRSSLFRRSAGKCEHSFRLARGICAGPARSRRATAARLARDLIPNAALATSSRGQDQSIYSMMQTAGQVGMQTFNQAIARCIQKRPSPRDALRVVERG